MNGVAAGVIEKQFIRKNTNIAIRALISQKMRWGSTTLYPLSSTNDIPKTVIYLSVSEFRI